MGLTENRHLDRCLGLLVSTLGHTLVVPGAVHGGVVDGEDGRGLVRAAHQDVLAGHDLLAARGVPVDVRGISHNCTITTTTTTRFDTTHVWGSVCVWWLA